MRKARPVGMRRATRARSGAPSRRRCGNGTTATAPTSPRRCPLLRALRNRLLLGASGPQFAWQGWIRAPTTALQQSVAKSERRQVVQAEELDLVLELDAELLERAPPRLLHERERVGRAGFARVLDEVRMPRRDLRAADAVPLQAAGLEHAAGGELVVGVLEDAAERALVRRLNRLATRLEVGDRRLDLPRRPRGEPELGSRDHLAVAELGVPVAQAELGRCPPRCAFAVHHEGADEDLRPVAAVGARVHPHAAADRAGNRARELEAAEP